MAGRKAAAAVVALLAACGSATSAPQLTRDPIAYLLSLDQLGAAGFSVETAPAHATAADLASGSVAAQRLSNDGLRAAATVSYSRDVDFATSNGPIVVIDTVERFASNGGAEDSFGADITERDMQPGEVATSAGPLGDQAHADTLVMNAPDGVAAVQIIVEWRVANAVVILALRGRYGGTRLNDALTLAHQQTSAQLNLSS
jgi:hypothetical protein